METPTQSDHDLLIRIDEKLNVLLTESNDHETRIRRMELWGGMAVGFMYAIQFYLTFVKQ